MVVVCLGRSGWFLPNAFDLCAVDLALLFVLFLYIHQHWVDLLDLRLMLFVLIHLLDAHGVAGVVVDDTYHLLKAVCLQVVNQLPRTHMFTLLYGTQGGNHIVTVRRLLNGPAWVALFALDHVVQLLRVYGPDTRPTKRRLDFVPNECETHFRGCLGLRGFQIPCLVVVHQRALRRKLSRKLSRKLRAPII
jgi:hypothetical protein